MGVGALPEAPRRLGGLRPGPRRPSLAGRGPGLRQLVAPRARGAQAVAGLRGAGRPGARQPRPCRRFRRPLELLRVHDLARLRPLRSPRTGSCWGSHSLYGLYAWPSHCRTVWDNDYVDVWLLLDYRNASGCWRLYVLFEACTVCDTCVGYVCCL